MGEPPTAIRARQADQALEMEWPDGTSSVLSYRDLRGNCPCATCRDEWTGERILDPATIRPDLKIETMESIGNYAVQFNWNDGHGSGIFTWDFLRGLTGKTEPPPEKEKWRGIDPPPPGS
jgi:DUF971 family protein